MKKAKRLFLFFAILQKGHIPVTCAFSTTIDSGDCCNLQAPLAPLHVIVSEELPAIS